MSRFCVFVCCRLRNEKVRNLIYNRCRLEIAHLYINQVSSLVTHTHVTSGSIELEIVFLVYFSDPVCFFPEV